MKKLTTIEIGNEELTHAILQEVTLETVKLVVPRKKEDKPTANIIVSNEDLIASIAFLTDMTATELEQAEISLKKDGIAVTY